MTAKNGTVDAEKLTNFATKALQKVGVPKEDAQIAASILVATDLRGIDSHGVGHLAADRAQLHVAAAEEEAQLALGLGVSVRNIADMDDDVGIDDFLECRMKSGDELGREFGDKTDRIRKDGFLDSR